MPDFAEIYARYIESANRARQDNKLEQERKRLFFGFLQEGFGVQFEAFEIEKRVRLASRNSGFVDAIFGDLIFEFKQDLGKQKQKTIDQLREYLNSEEMRDQDYLGVLSDGLHFEVYVREGAALRELDSFELKAEAPDDAFARLDAYLFSQKAMRPTAQDIVAQYDGNNSTFLCYDHR